MKYLKFKAPSFCWWLYLVAVNLISYCRFRKMKCSALILSPWNHQRFWDLCGLPLSIAQYHLSIFVCSLVCDKYMNKELMLSLYAHPTQYSFASYSITTIVKFQTMIHQVNSECLGLHRKAAAMSHLCAFSPQFSSVALECRTGFHPWSLVICWNNNA